MFKKVKRFIRHKIDKLYIRWLLKGIDTKEYCDVIRKATEEM